VRINEKHETIDDCRRRAERNSPGKLAARLMRNSHLWLNMSGCRVNASIDRRREIHVAGVDRSMTRRERSWQ
jgi:hypothetical protein